MSKYRPIQKKLTPQEDYWRRFLEEHNMVGIASEETETTEPSTNLPIEPLSPDMFTFVYRVAEGLTPIDGLDAYHKQRGLQVREQFRKELSQIMQGKGNFNKWFDETKTKAGLHLIDFFTILYGSLEGLKSPEARELRQQYSEALAQVKKAYTP